MPVKLRLCQVDRAKHHNILNYINSISRLSSRKAKRPRYWVLVFQHTNGGGAQFRHNTDFLSFRAITFAWNSCFSNKFLGYKGFKSPPLPVTSKITHPSCSWAFLSTVGLMLPVLALGGLVCGCEDCALNSILSQSLLLTVDSVLPQAYPAFSVPVFQAIVFRGAHPSREH